MICGQLKKKDPYGHMNKNKTVNKIAIGFMILIVILFLTVVISALIKSPKSYEGEESLFRTILEKSLIILVVGLVIVGLIIGYKRLEESDKQRYLRLVKENKDDYQLRYEDNYFYLKKEELRK